MSTATQGRTRSLVLGEAAQDLLFREARTANTFTTDPVDDEQMRAVYELVKYGPTEMNQSPLRIVLLRSEEARSGLVPHLAEGNRKKTETAPLVAVLAADTRFHDELPKLFPHFPGARDMYEGDAVARVETGRLNTALQIAYLIVGIRAAGLAAGPMSGFDAEGVTKEFFPDGEHQAMVVVNIGHPGENAWFPRLPRLDYDEVVTTL